MFINHGTSDAMTIDLVRMGDESSDEVSNPTRRVVQPEKGKFIKQFTDIPLNEEPVFLAPKIYLKHL